MIRSVPAATVKKFYQKWYHLCNMAVVAVGDFPDTKVHLLFYLFLMIKEFMSLGQTLFVTLLDFFLGCS